MKKPSLKPVVIQIRKKATGIMLILLCLQLQNIKAQNKTVPGGPCPTVCGPLSGPVSTASELMQALCYYCGNDCSNPVTIKFANNARINLGTIAAVNFPLTVPAGVTLSGDFSIFNSNCNNSYGTTLIFPYLFEGGYECNANFCNCLHPPCVGNALHGAVFNMLDCSQIKNIRLIGPKTDLKDYGFGQQCISPFRNTCDAVPTPSSHTTQTGLAVGIEVNGTETYIEGCEIYGFPMMGIMVKDLIVNVANYNGPAGNCYINDTYIHNCKGKGYGYGLWVTGGGQPHCDDDNTTNHVTNNWACDNGATPDPTYSNPAIGNNYWDHFYNFNAPDERVHLTKCVFYDNNHDIDAAGANRNSVIFFYCTFSQKTMSENINKHYGDAVVCNPTGPAVYDNTLSIPNRSVIIHASGTKTEFNSCVFYNYGLTQPIAGKYPNINNCPSCTQCYTPDIPGLTLEKNFFRLPTCSSCTTTVAITGGFDCNAVGGKGVGGNPPAKHFNFLDIDGVPHWQWNFLDPAETFLTIGEDITNTANICKSGIPDALSGAPVAVISSMFPGGPITTAPKKIAEGGTLIFDISQCMDGSNPRQFAGTAGAHDMIYMWRFHSLANDVEDEIRTSNVCGPVSYSFNKAGIVNVNLMVIDAVTGIASDEAKQQITVIPANNDAVWLIFNIKDSYSGRQVATTDKCENLVDDIRNAQQATEPTWFQKYAAVSTDGGVTFADVWVDDIQGDEGWQYVKINLSERFLPQFLCEPLVEIGLRAVANPETGLGPDASVVRSVTLSIDDGYVNSFLTGDNLFANGDFEESNNTSIVDIDFAKDRTPAAWQAIDETPSVLTYNFICDPWPEDAGNPAWGSVPGFPTLFTRNANGSGLSTAETRSGFFSYEGYVKSFALDVHKVTIGGTDYYYDTFCDKDFAGTHGNAYRTYNVGKYKAVRQFFKNDRNYCAHLRTFDFKYELMPSASLKGNEVDVKILRNTSTTDHCYISIIDLQGKEVYSNNFNGRSFTFNNVFKPGVYSVKISSGDLYEVKKLVSIK